MEVPVGGMFASLGGKKKKKAKKQAEEAAKELALAAERVDEPVKSAPEPPPRPFPSGSGSWAEVAKKKPSQKPVPKPSPPAPEPVCERSQPCSSRPRKAAAMPAPREQVHVGSVGSSGAETTEGGLTSDEEEGWTFVLRPEDDWEIIPPWPTLPDARTCLKGWF